MVTKGEVFSPSTNTILRRAATFLLFCMDLCLHLLGQKDQLHPIFATEPPPTKTFSCQLRSCNKHPSRVTVASSASLTEKAKCLNLKLLNQGPPTQAKGHQGSVQVWLVWRPPGARWENWPGANGGRTHPHSLWLELPWNQ